MTESSTILDSTLSKETLDRLADLRKQRRAITHEIKEILAHVDEDIIARPTVQCLRCGFTWTPHNPLVRPRCCARCVTTAWDKPPTATSRRPSDPPSSSWRVRSTTARRRPRMQPEPKRILHRRTKEEIAADKALNAKVTTAATAPDWYDSTAIPPLWTPPPRISALLPPPPTPSPSHAPSITLSAWLRDVAVEDGKSEPQPERVSSHAALPESQPMEVPDEHAPDTPVSAIVPVEIPSLAEEETVIDVPPEQVGAPRTDAEREELARAKEEVWPTTRGDE